MANQQRYIVTARKYRPKLFREVVAQGHVTDTLKNALRLDRLAHAYLFSGPRGVGKTTTARILAKAINCETPREEREDEAEPCCECDSCLSFEEGRSLNVFEMDAASNNKVDDIRELREKVRIPPQGSTKKVYILDEVHMLSTSAFNALLKTLEEPPPHALFIFATTEPHKVLPTILSRCQRFDFRRIPVPEIVDRLREICEVEDIDADEESLMLLARKGDGALRDALSAFDQAISLCGTTIEYGELTQALGVVDQDLFFRLTKDVAQGSTTGVLKLVNHVVRNGYDLNEFLAGVADHLRNLLVAHSLGGDALEEVAESTQQRYVNESRHFSESDLLRLLMITGDAEEDVKGSSQPRLKLEMALLKMASLTRSSDLKKVIAKVERLEQMVEDGEIPDDLPALDGSSDPSGSGASSGTTEEPTVPYDTGTPGAQASSPSPSGTPSSEAPSSEAPSSEAPSSEAPTSEARSAEASASAGTESTPHSGTQVESAAAGDPDASSAPPTGKPPTGKAPSDPPQADAPQAGASQETPAMTDVFEPETADDTTEGEDAAVEDAAVEDAAVEDAAGNDPEADEAAEAPEPTGHDEDDAAGPSGGTPAGGPSGDGSGDGSGAGGVGYGDLFGPPALQKKKKDESASGSDGGSGSPSGTGDADEGPQSSTQASSQSSTQSSSQVASRASSAQASGSGDSSPAGVVAEPTPGSEPDASGESAQHNSKSSAQNSAQEEADQQTLAGMKGAWSTFVKTVKAERISLGSQLGQTSPVGLSNGTAKIAVPDNLTRERLRDEQRFLLKHLDDAVKTDVEKLRFVVQETEPDEDDAAPSDDMPIDPFEKIERLRNSYPALDRLVTEFGAEPAY